MVLVSWFIEEQRPRRLGRPGRLGPGEELCGLLGGIQGREIPQEEDPGSFRCLQILEV